MNPEELFALLDRELELHDDGFLGEDNFLHEVEEQISYLTSCEIEATSQSNWEEFLSSSTSSIIQLSKASEDYFFDLNDKKVLQYDEHTAIISSNLVEYNEYNITLEERAAICDLLESIIVAIEKITVPIVVDRLPAVPAIFIDYSSLPQVLGNDSDLECVVPTIITSSYYDVLAEVNEFSVSVRDVNNDLDQCYLEVPQSRIPSKLSRLDAQMKSIEATRNRNAVNI